MRTPFTPVGSVRAAARVDRRHSGCTPLPEWPCESFLFPPPAHGWEPRSLSSPRTSESQLQHALNSPLQLRAPAVSRRDTTGLVRRSPPGSPLKGITGPTDVWRTSHGFSRRSSLRARRPCSLRASTLSPPAGCPGTRRDAGRSGARDSLASRAVFPERAAPAGVRTRLPWAPSAAPWSAAWVCPGRARPRRHPPAPVEAPTRRRASPLPSHAASRAPTSLWARPVGGARPVHVTGTPSPPSAASAHVARGSALGVLREADRFSPFLSSQNPTPGLR